MIEAGLVSTLATAACGFCLQKLNPGSSTLQAQNAVLAAVGGIGLTFEYFRLKKFVFSNSDPEEAKLRERAIGYGGLLGGVITLLVEPLASSKYKLTEL